MTSDRFRLFVDVDIPNDAERLKTFRRRSDKGSVYITDEEADVQVWVSGSPATLRLLATKLTALAEDVEVKASAGNE